MKIKMQLEVNKNELPVDYRRACVSFIKASIYESSPKLFEELYGDKKAKQKNFSFNLKVNNPKFQNDKIIIGSDEVLFVVSTNDTALGIDLYNCFLNRKNKLHPLAGNNSMIIKNIRIENHNKIKSGNVMIKFYSPFVLRKHIKGEKDIYYLFDDEDFSEQLNQCVKYQLINCGFNDLSDYNIELKPIDAKKVVVKTFGINIPGSLGIFELKANLEIINLLYQMSIGSRRSEGFGTFEIIDTNVRR